MLAHNRIHMSVVSHAVWHVTLSSTVANLRSLIHFMHTGRWRHDDLQRRPTLHRIAQSRVKFWLLSCVKSSVEHAGKTHGSKQTTAYTARLIPYRTRQLITEIEDVLQGISKPGLMCQLSLCMEFLRDVQNLVISCVLKGSCTKAWAQRHADKLNL